MPHLWPPKPRYLRKKPHRCKRFLSFLWLSLSLQNPQGLRDQVHVFQR
jgi:hypothetical protein